MLEKPDNFDIDEPLHIEAKSIPCPDGYPPDDWAKLGDGNKAAYLHALEQTAKLTGGK